MVMRSLNGESQLTRWLVTTPDQLSDGRDQVLVLATAAGCVRAETETKGLWATHAVRSMSWVARSLTTPTSAMRAGNGPCRRVTTW